MVQPYIRLNDNMVVKRKNRYHITSISRPKKWTKMTTKQRESSIVKDVTSEIKNLLRKHGSKSNMNFKTKPSKKMIRTKRKPRKKKMLAGGPR